MQSISQKFNDARPYTSIEIHKTNGNSVSYGPNDISFSDAYAKDGFFVVVLPTDPRYENDSKNYNNLSTTQEIDIQTVSEKITIYY